MFRDSDIETLQHLFFEIFLGIVSKLDIWKGLSKMMYSQRWKVTKYIYLSTVLKYKFEELVLYLSTSIFCYFKLLHHISEGNIVLFTPLQLSDNLSYFLDSDYYTKYNQQIHYNVLS